jgi:hypothetical protein
MNSQMIDFALAGKWDAFGARGLVSSDAFTPWFAIN